MGLETWSPQSSVYGAPQKPEGDGWVLTGYNPVRVSNPKMGSGFTTTQVPVYMRQTAPEPTPAPAPAPAPPPPPVQQTPVTLPTPPRPEPQGPTMSDAASKFADQIAAMQQGLQSSLAQQASQFAQMQQAQNDRMETLQQQMMQTMASSADRPQVAGVKTATSSSGTDMQIARRGVKGALGRTGMRIKSLNV